MRIDTSRHHGPLTARQARDLLRRSNRGVTRSELEQRADLDSDSAGVLLEALEAEGLVSRVDGPNHDQFEVTSRGRAFALARLTKPIKRPKVDDELAALTERAAHVNADSELMYWVTSLDIFGSAADPAATDFGDIDVAVTLTCRATPANAERWRRHRLAAATRRVTSDEAIWYPETEIMALLKNRSRYLSLVSDSELERLGATSIGLYAFDPVAQPAPEAGLPSKCCASWR